MSQPYRGVDRIATHYKLVFTREIIQAFLSADLSPPYLITREPLKRLLERIQGVSDVKYSHPDAVTVRVEYYYDDRKTWSKIEEYMNRYLEATK